MYLSLVVGRRIADCKKVSTNARVPTNSGAAVVTSNFDVAEIAPRHTPAVLDLWEKNRNNDHAQLEVAAMLLKVQATHQPVRPVLRIRSVAHERRRVIDGLTSDLIAHGSRNEATLVHCAVCR